jgi:hypothetical protein
MVERSGRRRKHLPIFNINARQTADKKAATDYQHCGATFPAAIAKPVRAMGGPESPRSSRRVGKRTKFQER